MRAFKELEFIWKQNTLILRLQEIILPAPNSPYHDFMIRLGDLELFN
jgi:hypothetical protein